MQVTLNIHPDVDTAPGEVFEKTYEFRQVTYRCLPLLSLLQRFAYSDPAEGSHCTRVFQCARGVPRLLLARWRRGADGGVVRGG